MTFEQFRQRYHYNPDTDMLGEGGFGSVYKAYDTYRDIYVAIKKAEVKKQYENFRLKNEVELVNSLKHPNIAYYSECYSFYFAGSTYDFAVLQYYELGNLQQLVQKHNLSFAEKEYILLQLLDGIEFLHSKGIIQRDLKPANILIVNRDGKYIPKITDFGISKKHTDKDTLSQDSFFKGGSPYFAAPEQLFSNQLLLNSDIWSFGVIACWLFTGKLPFNTGEDDVNSIAGKIELFKQIKKGKLPSFIVEIPEPWQTLIKRALLTDTNLRLKNINECREILNEKKSFEVEDTKSKTTIFFEDTTVLPTIPLKNSFEEFLYNYQFAPDTDIISSNYIGKVYLAYDINQGKEVIIKKVKRGVNTEIFRETKIDNPLEIEIRKERHLPKHPNIAVYYQHRIIKILDDDYDFGVQKYYKEGNLKQFVENNSISWTQKENILLQLLNALDFLHKHNIVCCNFRVENILIEKKGDLYIPKLTDFIIDKKGYHVISFTQDYLYAIDCYAPEQISNKGDKYSNIWNFGVLAYWLLIGKYPFSDNIDTADRYSLDIFLKRINSENHLEFIKVLPEPWCTVIKKCLKKDISSRFQTISDCEKLITTTKNKKLLPINNNSLYGFSDQNNNIIIPAIYNEVSSFSEGLAAVKLNEKWGYINEKGEEVIPFIYDGVIPAGGYINNDDTEVRFYKHSSNSNFFDGLAIVRLNNKLGCIDKTGAIIAPIKYDYFSSFTEGLAIVRFNGKYGFINKKGKLVTPCEYELVYPFLNGAAIVKNNSKYGCIDKKGKNIIPIIYDLILSAKEDGIMIAILNNKKGYINSKGKSITPFNYQFASYFKEGLAVVFFEGKLGYIDKTGKEVIPLKYDWACPFSEGLAAVKFNGKWGFIDKDKNEIISFIYDYAESFSNGEAKVKLNNSLFYIDKLGEKIIKNNY